MPDLTVSSAVDTFMGSANQAAMRTNIGLGNVNNTSDANKPLSSADILALSNKQGYYNILNYGADPTGAADSTAAWNAALTDAIAGNGWIHFPRGSYKGNFAITAVQSSRNIRITGDGAGATGDWTAVEPPGATIIRPNSNSEPVFKFDFIRGIIMKDMEIRGNGAGVSANGILIDNPVTNFAGNGLYIENVTIRAFTNGLNSIGACNVHVSDSGIFNNNIGIKVPDLPLAHSYLFEQCSLGGVATILGGSGSSRIFQVEDGSFMDIVNCEMGNCVDWGYTANAAIINIRGGNTESMSGNPLITMTGGTMNIHGVRLGAGNKTVVRAIGGTGEILSVCIEGNQAQGVMTMFDHHGIGYAKVGGNGLNKLITEYTDNTFTVVRGTSVCENLVVSARLTVDQVIAGAGTTTVIFNQENTDIGSKYNNATGEFAPGKRGNYMFSAGLDVNSGTAAPQLGVYIGGSLRAMLGQFVTASGGVGTWVGGTAIIPMQAGDVATIRIVTGAGVTLRAASNWNTLSIAELPYFN